MQLRLRTKLTLVMTGLVSAPVRLMNSVSGVLIGLTEIMMPTTTPAVKLDDTSVACCELMRNSGIAERWALSHRAIGVRCGVSAYTPQKP